ncbi:DJ-1/PfpI family protein [Streptomyces sp. NPDC007264]|uniref:DJ-1/PfpI family protein n=1 Tax=Streptomyces sp. NPDC007264 TaxID=3364777 RepID=UPI0036DD25C5
MSDVVLREGPLTGLRLAVLIESDFFEPEIAYYQRRFAEEGAEVDFLTRLWGNDSITFQGHEYRAPFTADKTFEGLTDEQLRRYAAVIVPSGMVSDRLRYTEDVDRPAPATDFLRRAFDEPTVLKGIICHGMWLASSIPEKIRGRKVVCHNNLVGDVRNMGAEYVDEDVVVDGDLVTGRTGGHHHLFARRIIELVTARAGRGGGS